MTKPQLKNGPTTKNDLLHWFGEGKKSGATHMIIFTDTFEWYDFPVYVQKSENPAKVVSEVTQGAQGMIVMECYDLREDPQPQLNEFRAHHWKR